jgi:SPX domain protein involved in polyphosphate accumulation
VPYGDRWVNNIYFDTLNNAAYEQNLSGASARVKLRYRWYGQKKLPSPGVMEVKCKRNFYGWKLRFDHPSLAVEERDDWRKITQKLSNEMPLQGKVWMETYPAPMIINRYYRRYFLSADGNIRVTVDTHQSVCDQRYKSIPNYDQGANLPDSLVVEVKFAREHRELAYDAVQTMPIRVSRHSKFMNGVSTISGNLLR